MNLKLKFLLPNVKAAHKASEAMLLARVEYKDVSFLAKPGTDLGELPEANAIEATNTLHEGLKGVLMGAGIGLLGGLYVLYFPKWFTDSPTWFTNATPLAILVITSVMGAAAAAFGAALLGFNVLNSDLRQFKRRIDDGAVLMIVATPFNRAKEIREVVKKLHLKY
ncbi:MULTISPECIES: hypothetical protein [Methylotenera]|uniref:hypothetical protein n=1 Tax=Methylotenera TaxID=359407 RepID=UPI0003727182|nr:MULTISPECIES: hypothetical protein [Methylotenera]